MIDNKKTDESILRIEAQAFQLDELYKNQEQAVKCILEKLQAAHSEIKPDKDKSYCQWTFPVPEENKNRVVFLSGGRGSGKTSVLFSLVKLCKYPELADHHPNREIKKICNNLKKKLIWLQPLEMEILPPSSNLLAAILSRVDEAVARFRGNHPPIYQATRLGPEEQDELLEFNKLQQDVAAAWNGNLEKHAVNIDPDAYAVEVLRAEQNRLDLNGRINRSLNQLHQTFSKPANTNNECLFVLPVDDFDLNPHRCLELIRMIRILDIPRLFTLILGDIRIISHLLDLKFIESIVALESQRSIHFSHIPSYTERRLSHELSANAIRKLFAESNRISLKRLDVEDVFTFPRKNKENIEYYLDQYKNIIINTGFREPQKPDSKHDTYTIAKTRINSLKALFNININKLISINSDEDKMDNSPQENNPASTDPGKNHFYIKAAFFEMYPRHVQDLHLGLRKDTGKDKTETENRPKYLALAAKLYKEKIRDGKDLTSKLSDFLMHILIDDFEGDYQLDTSALNLVYTYSQPIVIERDHQKPFIGMLRPKNWHLQVNYPEGDAEYPGMPNKITLDDSTASGIILMHDLLAFTNPRLIIGDRLLEETAPLWAYSQWPFGSDFKSIMVPWHFPPWVTMFECDLLRRCWIFMWNWIKQLKEIMDVNRNKNANFVAELVAYAWLKIITDIISNGNDSSDKIILLNLKEEINKIEEAVRRSKEAEKTGEEETIKKTIREEANIIKEAVKKIKEANIMKKVINWNDLFKKIYMLYKFEPNQLERRRFIIRGWFVAIGCFLAPETGLYEMIGPKIDSKCLRKILKILTTPIIASGIRKLRARSAVLFFDNGTLTLLKRLFEPQEKKDVTPQKYKSYTPNQSKSLPSINTIGNQILCPHVEDIIMLSKQTPRLKRQYTKELKKNEGRVVIW